MGILKSFVITFFSLWLLAWILPAISYNGLATIVAASIVLTILQKIVQPALKILLLPLNIITFGLFSWVINAIVLWLAVIIVPGFHIDPMMVFGIRLGTLSTMIMVSFILSLIQAIIEFIF